VILSEMQTNFTNKTDSHDITEILLKVALNTINQTKPSDKITLMVKKKHLKYISIRML
jgi:hypothetical protein